MNYEELLTEIWDLEEWLQEITSDLITYDKKFKDHYRGKYIDLLFEFFNKTYNFSNITSEICDINNPKDIEELMNDFEKFILNYSRLIQFFDFANVKSPDKFWSTFNYWKNTWIDLKDE